MDINYVTRIMLKRPGFTVFTLLIMASGLGLSIYMYSLINTLAFKPLPFKDGERMVMISPSINDLRLGDSPLSYIDYQAIESSSRTLEYMGYYYGDIANVSIDSKAMRYVAIRAQSDLFEFTDTQPEQGRSFNQYDIVEGANPVVIIGHQLWQNGLGGRTDILGQKLDINGVSTEIIGVMPAGYEFPMNNQVWLPTQLNDSKITRDNAPDVFVFAKLAQGKTVADADKELSSIMMSLATMYPTTNTGRSAFAITFMDSFIGEDSKPIFVVMLSGVAFVLLLACSNVGNLLLARASERSKESAIRMAHGAPTFRLIGQMMLESILICLLGGILGILLAGWGLSLTNHVIAAIVPDKPPFWWQLGLDADVLVKTIGLILLVSLLTGSLPAWRMTQCNITEILRDGTRGAQSRRSGKLSRALVVFEVLLSCTVLSLGAYLTAVVYEAKQIHYGINEQGLYTAKVSLPDHYDSQQISNFYQALQSELQAVSLDLNVGIMTKLPGEYTLTSKVVLEGQTALNDEQNLLPRANAISVLPGTLAMMGVQLQQGRLLDSRDNANTRNVVVITDSFAQRYWPGERNVLGKKLRLADSLEWSTVVGVVSHVIQGRPFGHSKHMPSVYQSLLQQPQSQIAIVTYDPIRANTRFNIEQAVANLDAGLSVYHPKTMTQLLERNTAGLTYIAILFNFFGIVAMLLAGSGIYGVMAKTISQRCQELGIRRAMGATEGDILRMLMIQGWVQLAIGLLLSAPIVFAAYPLVGNIVGTNAINPMVLFILIAAGIALIVSIAILIPAQKAIRQNPMFALREQ
ncbi:MacB [Xenorhabdus vietnamensis]|uniref:MacB n=2 Tax=Xenorhabdus vietnamensis TaxID=351656 RepID=A0A1Y2SAJ7_9GAMM|nr:MacB [Xenorhabdus vietnamensis]